MSKRCRRHHIAGWIFLILLIAVIASGFVVQQKTDFLHTAKFVPPFPTRHDCTEVENEINKYDWDHELALAIAKAESECDAGAHGDEDLMYKDCEPQYANDPAACKAHQRDYGYSVGIFQVRILPGREDCDQYDDVAKNVYCAYQVYKDKGDWTPWSGYTTGKYRNYMWHTLL